MSAIIMATFHEKSRHASFWGICVALAFSVVFMFPKSSGAMRPLIINPNTYAQANNATWIPVSVSFIMGFFLPLIGVAFLRDTIALDRINGVMTLMMTTRGNRLKYIIGKIVSNLAFLLIFLLTVMSFTLLGSGLKYGFAAVNIRQFLMPFVIIIPGLCFVAALTLLTETLPGLKGWFGTTGLLVLIAVIYASGTSYQGTPSHLQRIFNLSGSQYLVSNIKTAIAQTSGQSLTLLRVIGSSTAKYTGKVNLTFPTIQLTGTDVLNMAILVGASLLLVLLASMLIERRPQQRTKLLRFNRLQNRFTALMKLPGYTQFRLLTGTTHSSWLAMILIVWLLSWSGDAMQATQRNLPLLFLMAVPLFSQLGVLGQQTGVNSLLRTIPNGKSKALFQEGLAGVILAVVLILPILTKLSANSAFLLIIWGIQLALVAQTLGLVTSSSRAIQMVMIAFFYFYLNGAPVLPLNGGEWLFATMIYAMLCVIAVLAMLSESRVRFIR